MKKLLLSLLMASALGSAQATIFQYDLTFAPEAPLATGSGFGTVAYDNVAHTLAISCSFSGLSGLTGNSHIHAATNMVPFTGTAGVATTTPTFVGFPTGVQSGSYSTNLNLTLASSWNPAFVSANGGTLASAEAVLANCFDGRSYWNIHTTTFPGGEIRAIIAPVPEPSTFALAGLGIVGLAIGVRNRKRTKKA